MSDQQETVDQIKQLAEQFRVKAHLASMDAKVLWEEDVEPWLKNLDHKFDEATKDIHVADELRSVEQKLRKLVDDLIEQ